MTNEQLIPAEKQVNWGWAAVLNFITGGAGAGGYLFSSLGFGNSGTNAAIVTTAQTVIELVMPAVVCLGFLALAVEAGNPLNSRFLLRRLQSSWMSREALAFVVFIVAAVISAFHRNMFFQGIGIVAALVLIISQGFILYRSRGVPAWNVGIIPIVFLSSGLTSGVGLTMVFAAGSGISLEPNELLIGIISLLVNLTVWCLYLSWSKESEYQMAIRQLRRLSSLSISIGLGHAISILLLTFAWIIWLHEPASFAGYVLIGLAGLQILTAIACQKVGIILKAGYKREIRLSY